MIWGRHRSSEPRWRWLALDDASRDLLEALPGRCFSYGKTGGEATRSIHGRTEGDFKFFERETDCPMSKYDCFLLTDQRNSWMVANPDITPVLG
jgi:hypothetical protein